MNNNDWEEILKEVQQAEKERELKQSEEKKQTVYDKDIIVKDMFRIEILPINIKRDKYARTAMLQRYFDLFRDKANDNNTQRLLDQSRQELAVGYEKVEKMVKEDIDELERCLNAKAYKSVLILAGSILEAFLLDWLSSKDGRDYFKNPFFYKGKETSNLKDYIDAVPELDEPAWMRSNTHEIRKRRNLVHAKLMLKDEVGINSETCTQVIGYLKDVISKRRETETFL